MNNIEQNMVSAWLVAHDVLEYDDSYGYYDEYDYVQY